MTGQWGGPPTDPPPPPGYGPGPARSESKATAALVLGIVSLFFNFFLVPGILAIVWGGRERQYDSKAKAGYICGIIGTVLSVLAAFIFVSARS
ncbi:MAG: hypothetical protein M3O23_01580 [Actinomycetota bacterium]|nr:hypothetical protein [Actinomycetota bacterium]